MARRDNVTATFSEEMDQNTLRTDPATQTAPSVKLYERVRKKIRRQGKKRWVWRWRPMSAEVRWDTPCQMVTLDPHGTLAPYRRHLAVISTEPKDADSNSLARNYPWTFYTGAG